jgi:hypothetical protein
MVNSPQKKYSDSAKKVLPHLEMNELGGGKVLFRDDNNQTKKIPTVQPGLSDEEVTRRRGFPSEYAMLVYILPCLYIYLLYAMETSQSLDQQIVQ